MPSKKTANPIDVYVGTRVRLRRTLLGISQEKLGESLGVTFQQVQKYEKGTNRIGSGRLHAIAGVLKSPISFFFDGAPGDVPCDEASEVIDTQRLLADPRALALLQAFSILPADTKQSVLNITSAAAAAGNGAPAERRQAA